MLRAMMLLLQFLIYTNAIKNTQAWSSVHAVTKMRTIVAPTTSASYNMDAELYLGLPTATEVVDGVNTIQEAATGIYGTNPLFPIADVALFSYASNTDGLSKGVTAAGWGITPSAAMAIHTDMMEVVPSILATTHTTGVIIEAVNQYSMDAERSAEVMSSFRTSLSTSLVAVTRFAVLMETMVHTE